MKELVIGLITGLIVSVYLYFKNTSKDKKKIKAIQQVLKNVYPDDEHALANWFYEKIQLGAEVKTGLFQNQFKHEIDYGVLKLTVAKNSTAYMCYCYYGGDENWDVFEYQQDVSLEKIYKDINETFELYRKASV